MNRLKRYIAMRRLRREKDELRKRRQEVYSELKMIDKESMAITAKLAEIIEKGGRTMK